MFTLWYQTEKSQRNYMIKFFFSSFLMDFYLQDQKTVTKININSTNNEKQ